MRYFFSLVIVLFVAASISAQEPSSTPNASQQTSTVTDGPKKANVRKADEPPVIADPFDTASVEKMRDQCVTLETEIGPIEIEFMPEVAPESVRNFLNLAATASLDTTTFSRVVKDFVIQGGNLSTSENWGPELYKRSSKRLPDEPSTVKHERGIVSMARGDQANSASTHFFILVSEAKHLNGKFAAFGRVRKGMDLVDVINAAPKDGEKPEHPVRINKAVVAPCPATP